MWFILQEGMAYDLIIATTKIVNGKTLIETFMEKLGWLINVVFQVIMPSIFVCDSEFIFMMPYPFYD